MHLLVILGGEIERSINIVIRRVIVLENHLIMDRMPHLLSEAKVKESHCRLHYYHQ